MSITYICRPLARPLGLYYLVDCPLIYVQDGKRCRNQVIYTPYTYYV